MNEMEKKAKSDLIRRQLTIGRVRKELAAGLTTSEICEKYSISEAHIRSVVATIEEAEKNRKVMNTIDK